MVLEYDAKKPNLLDLIFQPSSEHCVRGREQVGYMVVDKKLQSPGPATCCVPAPASAPQLHRISAAWVSPAHKHINKPSLLPLDMSWKEYAQLPQFAYIFKQSM